MEEKDETGFIETLFQLIFQRLVIYQALHCTHEHQTAEIIHRRIKKSFPMVSLATVHKTLEKFCEVGLIQRVNPITETARYEVVKGLHPMVCMKCQSILNADNMVEEPRVSDSGQNGFHVLREQVFSHEYCPLCNDSIAEA